MVDVKNIEQIISAAEAEGGTIGVYVEGSDGWTFKHNGDRRFRAASTVKIPIMIEIFRSIDRGERSLDDVYTVKASDFSVGSGVLHEMHSGLQPTLYDLVFLMMSISDNTATNILIDMAGMENVNALLQEFGMSQSTLSRKMQGKPSSDPDRENWATPSDYGNLMRKVLGREVASPRACDQMINILQKQQNTRRIGRYVPADFIWGSKTGTIEGVVNDVGFVQEPSNTMVVSAYCENPYDMHTGEQIIGDIVGAVLKR